MTTKTPIFIVGAPRSGTTLLTAMLSNHENLDAGPETQFFQKISVDELYECVHDEAYPAKALSAIENLTLQHQSVLQLFGITKEEACTYLDNKEPSIAALLESITSTHCKKKNKIRWIEKTPNHIKFLDVIRESFPTAKIIRIVRDPRDTANSITKLPWTSDSVLANAFLVQEWHVKSQSFFQKDDNNFTVKYEELIERPKEILPEICNYIDETYSNKLLNTKGSGEIVSSPKETWKKQVSSGLDMSRVYVWKNGYDTGLYNAVTLCCKSFVNEFGYDDNVEALSAFTPMFLGERSIEHHINRQMIEGNEKNLIRLANKKIQVTVASSGDLLGLFPRSLKGKFETIKEIIRNGRDRIDIYRVENNFIYSVLYLPISSFLKKINNN